MEIRAALVDKPVLTMLLMKISALDPWMIGRFIPDKMWQTDANLYFSYAMEHAVWFSKVRKIPIFRASVSIMNGRLNSASVPGLHNEPNNMPTLLGHMERLAGHFENDAANQPMIYSVECTQDTHSEGKWFLLCHDSQVSKVFDWFNNEFDRIYKSSDKYHLLPLDSKFRQPSREVFNRTSRHTLPICLLA